MNNLIIYDTTGKNITYFEQALPREWRIELHTADFEEAVLLAQSPMFRSKPDGKARGKAVLIHCNGMEKEALISLIQRFKTGNPHLLVYVLDIAEDYAYLPKTKLGNLETVLFAGRSDGWYPRKAKRYADMLLAGAGMVALFPFLFGVGAAIKATSPGPVLYKQKRIGREGDEFAFYKFRSMKHNVQSDVHQDFVTEFIKGKTNGIQKLTDDPRVTPVGRFIRKTSVDELPQLINVFKGQMSLVGPRPCLPYEYKEYADWHKIRFKIQPGCTGLWQIKGRSHVSFDEMIMMDYYYMQNMSLRTDLRIMFSTIPVMISGKGGF